jgi:maltooligosyltrehalose synthase
LSDDGSLTIPPARWKDTRILLPGELQGIKLGSVLTGEEIATGDHPFAAAQILSSLPVALLTGQSR